ncbi:galanin receptor 2a-like [Periplaneta americana]|uniref:galanin receptor 2a-like n=1 Tax=Periplaneta americana TaxID=6978 RepID=UPI0037E90122
MLVFFVQALGLLCCVAHVSPAVTEDDAEAAAKTLSQSSCPGEFLYSVSPYWTSNDTDEAELGVKKVLHEIEEAVTLQKETLNSLVLILISSQREGFPKFTSHPVKLSHEEGSVVTQRNRSNYDKVQNNGSEEYDKYLKIIRNTTELMNHMMNTTQIDLRLLELDDNDLNGERTQNNAFKLSSLKCIINKYRTCMMLFNSTIEELGEALNLETLLEFRTKFNLSCNKLYDNETPNLQFNLEDHEDRNLAILLFSSIGMIFFFVGLIGNSVLLLIFIRHKEMRTAPNLMILNLNITDFLDLFINLILDNMVYIHGSWEYGLGMCKLFWLVCCTIDYATIYSIIAMYVHRCLVLTSPASNRSPHGKHHFALMIGTVWAISISLAAYPTFNSTITDNECKLTIVYNAIFRITQFMIVFMIPFIVITISSCITARVLKRAIPGERIGQGHVKKGRTLSSKVVIALTFVFALSYGTHSIFLCVNQWFTVPSKLKKVTYILTFADACFNPIALFLASKTFRKHMKQYLLFWKYSGNNKANTTSSVISAKTEETRL